MLGKMVADRKKKREGKAYWLRELKIYKVTGTVSTAFLWLHRRGAPSFLAPWWWGGDLNWTVKSRQGFGGWWGKIIVSGVREWAKPWEEEIVTSQHMICFGWTWCVWGSNTLNSSFGDYLAAFCYDLCSWAICTCNIAMLEIPQSGGLLRVSPQRWLSGFRSVA